MEKGLDPKRMYGIERITPRELPPVINTPMESFKEVIKGTNLTRDKIYGKVEKPGKQATKPWASNRPMVRGSKYPVKLAKMGSKEIKPAKVGR